MAWTCDPGHICDRIIGLSNPTPYAHSASMPIPLSPFTIFARSTATTSLLAALALLTLAPSNSSAQSRPKWTSYKPSQGSQPSATLPSWRTTPSNSQATQAIWKLTTPSRPPSIGSANTPADASTPSQTSPSKTTVGSPFVDLGAGVRIGAGEPTYAAVSARLGLPLSSNTGISIRPTYVIGNSDSKAAPNNQAELIIPLTLDLFTNKTVSVYLGPGASVNVDSSAKTFFSMSGGLDIKFNQKLRLSPGITYALDYDQSGRGDFSGLALIYYRL